MSPRWFASLILLLGAGCPLFYDLDEVRFAAPDTSASPEMGPRDMDELPVDADPPGDLGDVARPDLPPTDDGMPDDGTPLDLGPGGATCPGAAPLDGTCSLVAQDCPGEEICEVGLLMPGVETGCRARTAGVSYDLEVGTMCSPAGTNRCRPGLLCRDSVCVRYCYAESGIGCEAQQTCAPLDTTNLPGVGWCTDACP